MYNDLINLTRQARVSYHEMVDALAREVAEYGCVIKGSSGLFYPHLGHSRTPSGCSAISLTSSILSEPLMDRPLVDRPLVDRPLVDRPLVDRPLVDRPLVDRPLVDRPLVDSMKPTQYEVGTLFHSVGSTTILKWYRVYSTHIENRICGNMWLCNCEIQT